MMSRELLAWSALLMAVDAALWLTVGLWWPHAPVVAVLLAWSALSLLAVTALYVAAALGRDAGPVLQGARWPWAQPVFAPYRAVAYTLFALARWRRRGEVISEVAPGVFLGPRLFPGEEPELRRRGVTAVVDLTCELPVNRALAQPAYTRWSVPTLDRAHPVAAGHDDVVAQVAALVRKGERVYVHCAFGRGRSAAFVCAVLIDLGVCGSVDEAIAVVTKARPQVRVRGVQREGVARFAARRESSIAGGNGVSTATR